MKGVTAVIMGGGRGTRLFPLTLERSKPAVGFAGKYRLIDIPISNCIHSGIKRVFVLTQFLSASLHRHIMQTYQVGSFSDGLIDILAAEQTTQRSDWFQGTADAVRATLNHTTYYRTDQMLVLAGDHLYRMDYEKLLAFHRESGAEITVSVKPVSRREAPEMGLVQVDGSMAIRSFVEKPGSSEALDAYRAPPHLIGGDEESYLASMGIYMFELDVLRDVLAEASHNDFGSDVIPTAVGRRKVMAYPHTGYWKDIGTIDSFYEANLALTGKSPEFTLYEPGRPIYTRARALPPSRVIASSIRDCLLIEGSDISGAHIENSIVGVRSNIRSGSRLSHVVMMGADFYEGEQILSNWEQSGSELPSLGIGKNCRIERAIIDKNARIGDDVVIGLRPEGEDLRGENHWVRDGITIIPKGAVIRSGTSL